MILETSNGIRLIDPFNSIPGLRYVICDAYIDCSRLFRATPPATKAHLLIKAIIFPPQKNRGFTKGPRFWRGMSLFLRAIFVGLVIYQNTRHEIRWSEQNKEKLSEKIVFFGPLAVLVSSPSKNPIPKKLQFLSKYHQSLAGGVKPVETY